ncbi:sigma-54-dependent Fis family transcriptional regulator [Neiella sp. HB171785]|uniref:Sigma-54-dependent Fis family transcriptional regulator n=1 Tax=Neiella litorisoli TaxID=2771431 RepID=A0A8J6QTT9_9GAMM|nr:sigma-54 dependent transcriptional regulator [Neiella litorisoli]MBD1390769.1 sigma-54-dependent Fis family transcriptional regulator [Neiella litorisoli]
MGRNDSILLVEDSDSLAAVYQAYLADEPAQLTRVASGEAAIRAMTDNPPSVLLLDFKLPDMNGLDVLQWLSGQRFEPVVIMITAHGSIDVAVDAMRLGAIDFLEKPFDGARLQVTVRNAMKLSRLQNLVEGYEADSARSSFQGFIGGSLVMQQVYKMIEAVAPSKATVFITGESGTGKEVCAEAIHKQGPRANKPFIALNCGAIPKELMESEIFGHVKGAFTGAQRERKGAASLADGGTLFLDEIGEMDMDLQTKLLRFVQTGRFQRVGGSAEETVDVRFLCATNRDPWQEVQAGRFREDLYYRLYVVPIHLPPLRDRGQDVLAVGQMLLNQYAKDEGKKFRRFCHDVKLVLSRYQWPGNVRELQNVVRNICVLNDGEQVLVEHLPQNLSAKLDELLPERELSGDLEFEMEQTTEFVIEEEPQQVVRPIQSLWLTEKQAIEQAIDHCDGNIPKAAELLEVSPSTIYRKKQSWEQME